MNEGNYWSSRANCMCVSVHFDVEFGSVVGILRALMRVFDSNKQWLDVKIEPLSRIMGFIIASSCSFIFQVEQIRACSIDSLIFNVHSSICSFTQAYNLIYIHWIFDEILSETLFLHIKIHAFRAPCLGNRLWITISDTQPDGAQVLLCELCKSENIVLAVA